MTGLYADILPPRAMTLAEAAEKAIATAEAFNDCRTDGPEWDELDAAALDARGAFLDALAAAGISRTMLDRLQKAGVIW